MSISENIVQQALLLIKPGMTIGFGGGTTVGLLVKAAANLVNEVQILTPSPTTRQLATVLGYTVIDAQYCDRIDLAFDGCDQLDHHHSALKSGGGIHSNEKIIATLADEYWLLAPETKLVNEFDTKDPLVLEVLPQAFALVMHKVARLGGQPTVRTASNRDGMTLTDNGNLIIDCHFPSYQSLPNINQQLSALAGVVETSYFDHLVTNAIIGSPITGAINYLY
ncbi:ribose 5-phosphate isomerase A [Lactiplantibacillus mudanjiangensis]|uniref:Ribose 5-phosphate isomerase A n=1 Tax=Lactiplantibacillus mudanjiangensis TaxID=1296538 RepID=A0A660E1A9_9LACO|nr:ribose 5-phosphate isomerase A [Lactiplantibacillus mudanjiangensis]VDG25521.1 ribose 5-phosphate isomerase A [Lactobacillus sp.] [Lactiplantibacillus mudanjiangensis]VDG29135.1 ribose 5-phosphate isomerase A [Lactobacillus sp.] [Lactiplantibacillus mudanjiangensis]